MLCPNCNQENPGGAESCHTCGTDLPVEEAKKHETSLLGSKCPGCGATNPEGTVFCSLCGEKVGEAEVDVPSVAPSEVTEDVVVAPESEYIPSGEGGDSLQDEIPARAPSGQGLAIAGTIFKIAFLLALLGGGYFAYDFVINYGSYGVSEEKPLGDREVMDAYLTEQGFQKAPVGDGPAGTNSTRYTIKSPINPDDFKDVVVIVTDNQGRVTGVGGKFLARWGAEPFTGSHGSRFLYEVWKQVTGREVNQVQSVQGRGMFAHLMKADFYEGAQTLGYWKKKQIGGGQSTMGMAEVSLYMQE
ncbi:MAG: zinc ribbon domain-containing protein [Planctomycetota bacterium]